MASQGAHDLAPDSRWAPVAAGLATGLAGGGVVNSVENALTRSSTAKAVTDAADALETAKNAKFEGANALDQQTQAVKKASAADFAATKGQIAEDLSAHHAQQDQAIGTVASSLGNSTTLQEAGTALQAHARDWINNVLPAKLGALWDPVDAAIPKGTQVALGNFTSALKGINSSAGALEPLAGLLKPGAPKALGKALDSVSQLGDLAGAAGTHSWSDVQQLRSTLGDAMSNPKVIADVGEKNLSRLYAGLTSDMAATAQAQGAGDLFSAANTESRRLYQVGEGPISRVVAGGRASADDPAPEAAAKSLLSGGKSGATDLAALRGEIPQGVNELAAAQLRLDPKGFSRLPPETLGALVPNPDQSATAVAAQLAKEQASASAAQGNKLAQQQHQSNVAEATAAQKAGNFSNASAVRSSSQALADAKAAQAAAKGPSIGGHSIQGLFGSTLGNELAVLGLKAAGLPGSDIVHGAVGSVIGAGLPMAYRGAKAIVKNPNQLVYPALGAEQGANQLSP